MTDAKRGGKREGSGRKKGSTNKSTASLKELASQYTEKAIQAFVDVIDDPDSPAAAKVQAAERLLDRGYGKATVHIETESHIMDKAMLEKIESVYWVRMQEADERQRQVLIERGIIEPDQR